MKHTQLQINSFYNPSNPGNDGRSSRDVWVLKIERDSGMETPIYETNMFSDKLYVLE